MGNGNGNETEKGGMGNGDRWYQFFFGLILNFYFKFFKLEVSKKLAVKCFNFSESRSL